MSNTKTTEHVYPVIHTIPQKGPRYIYSSTNKNGHFGVSKVIFGQSSTSNPIVDMDGQFGMSEHAMAIEVSSPSDATDLQNILKSETFIDVLNSCKWSNYMIDWRLFTYFKKDFYHSV